MFLSSRADYTSCHSNGVGLASYTGKIAENNMHARDRLVQYGGRCHLDEPEVHLSLSSFYFI